MDVKATRQNFEEEQYIYRVSKLSPHKLLINYKGKKDNFPVKKFGSYHLNQVIKLTLPKMGQTDIMCLLQW